jgi:hypothetical protein
MKTTCQLPDLANAARFAMASSQLRNLNHNSILGKAIQCGVEQNNMREVISMIQMQAEDNRPSVAEVVGENLLIIIENITL